MMDAMPHDLPDAGETPGTPPGGASAKAVRVVRRLTLITGLGFAAIGVFVLAGVAPLAPVRAHALARTLSLTGGAGLALGALGLALTGELACLAILRARLRGRPNPRRIGGWWSDLLASRPRLADAGDAARRGQGILVPLLAMAAAGLAWQLRAQPVAPAPLDALIVAAALVALAFPMLVAERIAAALSAVTLPEAAALRALLLLPVVFLPIAAADVAGIGVGLDWVGSIAIIGCGVLALIGLELALRALARWFLPAPAPDAARAAVTSLLASMLAGSFGREGIGGPLRAQLGLDFARSWALLYLRAAALPALLLSALLCWGLSGLVAIGIDERGVYERFGAPVEVLRAGLHLILPWPLGRVRRLPYGTVQELALGGEATMAADGTTAEAQPPPSADRLWDQTHPGEVTYLIASESQGRQGFQIVNADVRVLWRIGLDDADARRATYGASDPERLIRESASRALARFFAARTLDAVLGERRETMATSLRTALTEDLAPLASGVEILDVVIEAVHPPAGAAGAYHSVQAAAIEARSSVAREQGRARGTENQARQEVHRIETGAAAGAAETVQTAQAEAVRFDADRAAYAQGGRAFLLERYLGNLASALVTAPLTIIDNRLDAATAPIIDLRPYATATTPTPEDPD
jgi:regulator of protease activity HflC (stomatin/prohibitin superfamily)